MFELEQESAVKELNEFFRAAANGPLMGILGFEERPLVSADFTGDPRSAIIDGPSTMVVNGTQAKIYAWYDNEWGYEPDDGTYPARGGIFVTGADKKTVPRGDGRTYAAVTAVYWAFTLTDGGLRMLVLLHFHQLGFTPLDIAFLFLLYEATGVLTNFLGGWIGARFGVRITLFAGLAVQISALFMLSATNPAWTAFFRSPTSWSRSARRGQGPDQDEFQIRHQAGRDLG